ncbi:hypothetical protein GP486_004459 [Trichoglossum hirsutum]|uniref:Uncharacterized protein n=1 Tax=Trichoglossum hirsutum TaxID=265104 RepID=A0A9P8LB46_9PEZI|nr:hypothetical protein GP486_004459 [Trichoglossum hirsutum]
MACSIVTQTVGKADVALTGDAARRIGGALAGSVGVVNGDEAVGVVAWLGGGDEAEERREEKEEACHGAGASKDADVTLMMIMAMLTMLTVMLIISIYDRRESTHVVKMLQPRRIYLPGKLRLGTEPLSHWSTARDILINMSPIWEQERRRERVKEGAVSAESKGDSGSV